MKNLIVAGLVVLASAAGNRVFSLTMRSEKNMSTSSLLIPKPKSLTCLDGTCRLSTPIAFNIPKDGNFGEQNIRLILGKTLALASQPSTAPPEKGLQLLIADPDARSDSPEAYRLRIEAERIIIVGKTAEGVLNGLRTLAQLAIKGNLPQCEIADWPDFSLRAGHLCYHLVRESLAYNTPNFEALLKQIDRLASVKMNAVLLELESLFPFKRHPLISCKIAFTPDQIARLRARLNAHHMEIIPLVQCLGHAYNVLAHNRYAEYRELPDMTQQYCPTNPKVADLYMDFVEDYMETFPEIKQWHLGGDESRMLGNCPRCKAKQEKLGVSRLYVDHVGEITRRVTDRGLTPLLWSDMLEHHPEAMELLPDNLKIVYWNYDFPTWPRPYAAPMFMEKGFQVIGATGVRFGATGTELSVYYLRALRGLEGLTWRLYADGCREMMTTNWMKGSPHESTDYGMVYGAALCWNQSISRADFQKRYARLTFGSADPRICLLYETLSLWLPYAEPVLRHQAHRLDRFNLSGLRFGQKWEMYTNPAKEPEVLEQLHAGLAAADETLAWLEQLRTGCTRGRRQFEMLELSAQCIKAKAQLGIALHEGRRLENKTLNNEAVLRWCSKQPAILGAWRAAKEKHQKLLTETGFKPCIDFLSELMFEPAEYDFLVKMGNRLASKIASGKQPSEVAIAFLDNPGPPYRRGFVHGETFKSEIDDAITKWCKGLAKISPWQKTVCQRMQGYVDQRFPEIMDELRGIADGSGSDFEEIFWLNTFNAIGHIKGPQSCSTIISKGKNGELYLAKTSDIDYAQRRMMILRRVNDGTTEFYVLSWVGTLWVQAGLTGSGLAMGTASAPVQPGQSGHGIPQHFGLYPLLYKASNVKKALGKLSNYDFAGKGLIFGLADAEGQAVIVEKSGTAQAVRPMKGNHLLGVNDFESENMKAYNSSRSDELIENCDARRRRLDRWIKEALNIPREQALQNLLADAESEGAFCQTGQSNLYTEAAIILSSSHKTLTITGLPPSLRSYTTWGYSE
jgi:hypothetical protein